MSAGDELRGLDQQHAQAVAARRVIDQAERAAREAVAEASAADEEVTRWALSLPAGAGGPQRDPATGRFVAREADDELRPMPPAAAYHGGAARGVPIQPARDPGALP